MGQMVLDDNYNGVMGSAGAFFASATINKLGYFGDAMNLIRDESRLSNSNTIEIYLF